MKTRVQKKSSEHKEERKDTSQKDSNEETIKKQA